MSDLIHSVEIDETHRFAVYPDNDSYADAPYAWGNYQVFTTRIARGLRPLVTPDSHTYALQAIVDAIPFNTRVGGDQPREDALMKHLDRNDMVGKLISLSGWSQGEWAEVLVYLPKHEADYLDGHIETLRQWFRGDVYTLAYEELVTYTAPNGNTIDRWETVEACGGNYIQNYYDSDEVRDLGAELLVTA